MSEVTNNIFQEKLIGKNVDLINKFKEALERIKTKNEETKGGIDYMDDVKVALNTDKNLEENPPVAKPYDRENGAAVFTVKGEANREYKFEVILGGDYEFAHGVDATDLNDTNVEQDADVHHEWIESVTLYRKYETTGNWEELRYHGDFEMESKLMSVIKIDWDDFVKEHKGE